MGQNTRLDTDQYTLVKEEVRKFVSKAKAAGVLRLVFHDAGTFALDDKTGNSTDLFHVVYKSIGDYYLHDLI